jgi:hypothetical protein
MPDERPARPLPSLVLMNRILQLVEISRRELGDPETHHPISDREVIGALDAAKAIFAGGGASPGRGLGDWVKDGFDDWKPNL